MTVTDTQGTQFKNQHPQSGGWQKTLLICVVIAALGGGLLALIFYTEPGAVREGATRQTAMLVDTATVKAGDFTPVIRATGIVVPAQRIQLSSRVSGEVSGITDHFEPGGLVKKGELLLQLDEADYQLALQRALNELDQARADLAIEMGQQAIAKTEYELMKENISAERKALVLREPQLAIARANVQSAETAVEQARLDLERTQIMAPFNGQVTERHVNLGSQVSAGDPLAAIIGSETYWVEATVPLSKLQQLWFPDSASDTGALVKVRQSSAWPENRYRQGRLTRLIGELNQETRMARLLITVDDPLGQRDPGLPRLMAGSFVEADIEGKPLSNVVRLSRDYLRTNDTVWVMKDGKLDIREVEISFRDQSHVYIAKGLKAGEKVVTTNLATITEGAALRLSAQEGESP